MSVDMHTHTMASDGILSPAALVDQAFSQGLSGVAITDHDTLAVCRRGKSRRRPTIFTSCRHRAICQWQNRELHILGYWPDT